MKKYIILAVISIIVGFIVAWNIRPIYTPTEPRYNYIVTDHSVPFGVYYTDDIYVRFGDDTILHGYKHWGIYHEGNLVIPKNHSISIFSN